MASIIVYPEDDIVMRVEIHEASGGRWALRVALIAAIFALAACTTPVLPLQPPMLALSPPAFPPSATAEPMGSTSQSPSATPLTTAVPTGPAAKADVLHVRAVQANDGAWTFEVTVQHPDTGWENYADGWDVITPEGRVILPDPAGPFTRRLEHPHVDEQPFTRSQSGIVMPPGVTQVRVRAHGLVTGYGGREVSVDLTQPAGPDFEVVPLATPQPSVAHGLTQQRGDGNRLADGLGALPDMHPVDIPLAGIPSWVVTAPDKGASIWAVMLADGRVQAFRVEGRSVVEQAIAPDRLPAGTPPVLEVKTGAARLLLPPADAAPLTHGTPLNAGGLAYVAANGDVVIQRRDKVTRFALAALPDARLLVDERDRLLLLTGATRRYDHGVLGDKIEAGSVTLVETGPQPRIALTITIPAPQVIEGLAPLWADLNGDSRREIIVTVSDNNQGAQEAVYDESGNRVAVGPAIGQGHRWRHQIAVAPFGPEGEAELVEVLTPHIGGVVQFYRLRGQQLEVVARVSGYTSHMIGSSNLDMAVVGDFDGDGRVELLLPDNGFTMLAAIRRVGDSAEVVWSLPVGARVTTNLAVVRLTDGQMAIGIGRGDGVLRVWVP